MICTKCKDDGVLNHANGKEFYYCRTCKEEIGLEPAEADSDKDLTQEEIDTFFHDFYYVNRDSYLTIYQDYEQECLSISPHWSDND